MIVVDAGSSGYRLCVSTCTRSSAVLIQEIASKVKIFADTLCREPHENRANFKDLGVGVALS